MIAIVAISNAEQVDGEHDPENETRRAAIVENQTASQPTAQRVLRRRGDAQPLIKEHAQADHIAEQDQRPGHRRYGEDPEIDVADAAQDHGRDHAARDERRRGVGEHAPGLLIARLFSRVLGPIPPVASPHEVQHGKAEQDHANQPAERAELGMQSGQLQEPAVSIRGADRDQARRDHQQHQRIGADRAEQAAGGIVGQGAEAPGRPIRREDRMGEADQRHDLERDPEQHADDHFEIARYDRADLGDSLETEDHQRR
jgi:hypothetical protein